MVAHVLGRLDQLVDEPHGADEVGALEGLHDRVAPRSQPSRSARRDSISLSERSSIGDRLEAGPDMPARDWAVTREVSRPGAARAIVGPCGSQASYRRPPRPCTRSGSATRSSRSPTSATTRPRHAASPADAQRASARDSSRHEIDARVREITARGERSTSSTPTLGGLEPDLIVTQAVCEVCAVSYDDVRAVAARLPGRPRRALARPETGFDDVLDDLGAAGRGLRRGASRGVGCGPASSAARNAGRCRRPAPTARACVALEWLDPPYVGGPLGSRR